MKRYGPALVRAELDTPHLGTLHCGECPWCIACAAGAWVGELLAHHSEKHRYSVAEQQDSPDSRYDGDSKTAPAGNGGLTPMSGTSGKGAGDQW